jgi:hypothetical protein
MLGLAQTETLTPASHHSSLATHHRLNQSLVFVVFFAITRAQPPTETARPTNNLSAPAVTSYGLTLPLIYSLPRNLSCDN